MLCVVSEDTERVIGERRMATLRDLGSDPTMARSEDEVLAKAARHLATNAQDVPFALVYLVDEEGVARRRGEVGVPAGHPAAPPALGPGDWPLATGAAELV